MKYKVGSLVRCIWQPKVAGVDPKTQCCLPMEYTIKDEFGFIVKHDRGRCIIMFPQLAGYTHPLAYSAFEVINE